MSVTIQTCNNSFPIQTDMIQQEAKSFYLKGKRFRVEDWRYLDGFSPLLGNLERVTHWLGYHIILHEETFSKEQKKYVKDI